MMTRLAALVIAVAALAGAAVAYADNASTGLPNGNAVFGGGHVPTVGPDYFDFSLTATEGLTATKAKGTMIVSFGTTIVQVTCMNISGNDAVVGGIVRSSTSFPIGQFAFMELADNSLPGSGGSPDTADFVISDSAGKQPCPAASPGRFALSGGDVLVHAAT